MNKHTLTLLFIITSTLSLQAQSGAGYTGDWEGKLNVGVELRIIFHITATADGRLAATADSPDQAAYGMKCDSTVLKNDSLFIAMNGAGASFTGQLVNDTMIKGFFTQRMRFPLTLTRTGKHTASNTRPQTPLPPFPYKSEDVEYYNRDRSIRFGATITIPEGKGPFPAVMLISGSGAHNRDEEMLGHKPFLVLADFLTRNGFIVLRADERGVGKTTGVFSTATSADFAADISAGVDYLLYRPEVNRKKTGLIGHSEGGIIAPMVATSRKDIGFLILLAGPGINITDMMTEQNVAIYRSGGVSREAADAYGVLYKNILTDIMKATDTSAALIAARQSMGNWLATTDEKLVKEVNLASKQKQEERVKSFVETLSTPWFRYFLAYDPAPALEKVKCPVLALNGSKDIQVLAASNLAGIGEALKKGGNKKAETREIPQLNHLFQTCTRCTLLEYGQLTETFSPAALQIIGEWLDQTVK